MCKKLTIPDHFCKFRVEKVDASVARSTCPNQNAQNTASRALLETQVFQKCVQLWREANFALKSAKDWQVLLTFRYFVCGRRRELCTLSKASKTCRFWNSFDYNHHYTTRSYTTPHYTPLHSTTLHSVVNYSTTTTTTTTATTTSTTSRLTTTPATWNYDCNHNYRYNHNTSTLGYNMVCKLHLRSQLQLQLPLQLQLRARQRLRTMWKQQQHNNGGKTLGIHVNIIENNQHWKWSPVLLQIPL